mmetsp:Transcript_23086/g.66645  ORF Transcript_23086/g.66645 Transcript_23086/m.66645 type:complete len:129 (-) Transcript_23086:779-1165(-)
MSGIADDVYVSPMAQTKEPTVTTDKHAALRAELSGTAAEADSSLSMNMAEAAAAEMLHKSPTLSAADVPSKESNAVPTSAVNAEAHVGMLMSRPKSILAKNGTNLTFKYKRNPDLCAVVFSNPMAWNA